MRSVALWLSVVALVACAARAPVDASQTDGGADAGAPRADAGALADADAPDPPLCVGGVSVDGVYPKREYAIGIGRTLPDLTFATDDPVANGGAVALHEFFEPCAPRAKVLIVRESAGWCGTCRWHAGHTRDLRALDVGDRLRILDLVVADDDNVPAAAGDLAAFRARIDVPDRVAVDPGYTFGPVSPTRGSLPRIVLVDARTMKVVTSIDDPDPDLLAWRVRAVVAQLDGAPSPSSSPDDKHDGRFNREQWDLIRGMTLPGAPPADPTNAKADDAAAAALGRTLFSDAAMSPTNTVSCATCHDPARGYTDHLPQSEGVHRVDRHAPAVLLASHARWQFWDGRADTLWMQALGPIENANEFGSSRLFVVHGVFDRYKAAYEAVFGALPPMTDTTRFPATGKPGDASWQGMAAADQKAVTRAFVNVGKAIAAFERTLRMKPSRFEAYVAGDPSALTDAERDGLREFFTAGCAQCHYGPRLTDDAFHVVRFPTGRQDGAPDRGRIDGVAPLLASEFRADGEFSDAPSAAHGLAHLAAVPAMLGAFKTSTLRGIPANAPYGHGGTVATLADVTKLYATAGLDAGSPLAVGTSEPWMPQFTQEHADAMLPFLQALTAETAP